MKHLLLSSLLCFVLQDQAAAQMQFTVMAPSGLNMRTTPSARGQKIVSLPYGSLVEQGDADREVPTVADTIEGKPGVWMQVRHQGKKGYMFSGFLVQGELIVQASGINNAYRLLQPGFHCSAANYDPTLHWYALVRNNGKMTVRKTRISLKTHDEFTDEDEADGDYLLKVKADIEDSVFFYLGAREPLKEGNIFSEFLGDHWDYSGGAAFLYPEQSTGKYYAPFNYRFRAYEAITLTPNAPSGYERAYQVEFILSQSERSQIFNLSKDLNLLGDARMHGQYLTPQLIWWGDLNQDGLLDFIWYSHLMVDGCGTCWEYHLFLSDKNNPDHPIQKVADHVECNCLT